MIIGKAITAGGSGNLVVKILPEGYGQLDYIESTGTQWIDLGLPLNQDCKLEMKISHFDTVGNRKTFGSRASATSNNFSVVSGPVGGTMSIVTDFYNYNNNRLAYVINGEETLEIFISKEKLKINDTEKAVTTYGDFETPGNAYLFSCSGTYPAGYSSASMRLYYCKIYDNDVLVRNLIPCVNSSEEVGLYDIVNGIFYRNNGTGTFIAGKRTDAVNSNNIVCKLLVNTGAGAVVTATLDGSTASATANENGNVVFYLPKEGLWTVSATLDGETKSTEILVEHNVEEELAFVKTFRIIHNNVQYDYNFLEGWTWADFVASDFNDENFTIDGTNVRFLGCSVHIDKVLVTTSSALQEISYSVLPLMYVYQPGYTSWQNTDGYGAEGVTASAQFGPSSVEVRGHYSENYYKYNITFTEARYKGYKKLFIKAKANISSSYILWGGTEIKVNTATQEFVTDISNSTGTCNITFRTYGETRFTVYDIHFE